MGCVRDSSWADGQNGMASRLNNSVVVSIWDDLGAFRPHRNGQHVACAVYSFSCHVRGSKPVSLPPASSCSTKAYGAAQCLATARKFAAGCRQPGSYQAQETFSLTLDRSRAKWHSGAVAQWLWLFPLHSVKLNPDNSILHGMHSS